MIFTKGAHESAEFQNFDCSGESSPNLYFNRLLVLKVYKISAKKVQSNYVSWYWRVMQNLKKNRFVSKMTRTWWIFIPALKSLQNLHFDWPPSCKVYNVWPKSTEKLSFMALKSDAKFEEKLTCDLENDMKSLAKFHQTTVKNLKIRNFIGFFYPK